MSHTPHQHATRRDPSPLSSPTTASAPITMPPLSPTLSTPLSGSVHSSAATVVNTQTLAMSPSSVCSLSTVDEPLRNGRDDDDEEDDDDNELGRRQLLSLSVLSSLNVQQQAARTAAAAAAANGTFHTNNMINTPITKPYINTQANAQNVPSVVPLYPGANGLPAAVTPITAVGGAAPGAPTAPPACKSCNCKNSKCLKLYCECFANGSYCDNCNCKDCHNTIKYENMRKAAIAAILERNPKAFKPKIYAQIIPPTVAPSPSSAASQTTAAANSILNSPAPASSAAATNAIKAVHNRGCHCKKSHCLKKYCECYANGIECSANCKCKDCENHSGHDHDDQPGLSSSLPIPLANEGTPVVPMSLDASVSVATPLSQVQRPSAASMMPPSPIVPPPVSTHSSPLRSTPLTAMLTKQSIADIARSLISAAEQTSRRMHASEHMTEQAASHLLSLSSAKPSPPLPINSPPTAHANKRLRNGNAARALELTDDGRNKRVRTDVTADEDTEDDDIKANARASVFQAIHSAFNIPPPLSESLADMDSMRCEESDDVDITMPSNSAPPNAATLDVNASNAVISEFQSFLRKIIAITQRTSSAANNNNNNNTTAMQRV